MTGPIEVPVFPGPPSYIRRVIDHRYAAAEVYAICTWSPMVIHAVMAIFERDPSRVVLRRRGGVDVPLLDVKDAGWLAHFNLADLFMRGEFDHIFDYDTDPQHNQR